MFKILFVCSQNKLRSPTAEHIFSQLPGLECQSAGVHDSADVPLDPELILWADVIYVMESVHRDKIRKKFRSHLNGKRIAVLNIPDDYPYMDEALIALLRRKVMPLIAAYVR